MNQQYILLYTYSATFSLAPDFLEKRILAVERVFLPGADIHVSIGVGAVLGGESGTPIPPGYFHDVIAENHCVTVI
jgi:hypothetical protein